MTQHPKLNSAAATLAQGDGVSVNEIFQTAPKSCIPDMAIPVFHDDLTSDELDARLEGLVQPRREGKTIYYSLTDDRCKRIISVVYDLFCKS